MNKLLALLQILIKQTDENHKLTTNQLIENLQSKAWQLTEILFLRISKG